MNNANRKFKKTIAYVTVSEITIYLGIHLTKEVEDLYTENDKTELKEMEENLTKWKVSLVAQW